MASILKDKISNAMSSQSATDTGDEDSSKDKYMLKVTAGTSYATSTNKTVVVNGGNCVINNKLKVAVRIQDFHGMPGDSVPESAYFKDPAHTKDTYSIAFSWAPEEDVSAEDLVWGIEMVNPIGDRIPKKFITSAFEICKRFVDSSLICDPSADKPWVNGAILCGSAMTWSVGSRAQQAPPPDKVLSEGAKGDGQSIRKEHQIPDDETKRRKFFSDEANRKAFSFEKGRCYQFDFHNGYIDWKDYALKLPGFSLNVLKWINDRTHTVRFVMKNRRTGRQYLVVTFRLLFGKELERALKNGAGSGQNKQSGSANNVNGVQENAETIVATKHARSSENGNDSDSDASDYHSTRNSSSPKAETVLSMAEESTSEEHSSGNVERSHSSTVEVHGDYMPENCGQPGKVQPQDRRASIQEAHISNNDTASSRTPSNTDNNETEAVTNKLETMEVGQSSGSGKSYTNGDSPPEEYRSSIEKSLLETMSVDARGKATNVLR